MGRLKILLVLQTPWGTGLGMSKVHHDLKEEYIKSGNQVEYLDWDKLYPKGQSAFDKIFGPLYSERIYVYLKQNANKYDVIDANFNCIPYPKSTYNFAGLVVYRSHGLQPLYRQIEQSARYKRMENFEPNKSFRSKVGSLYRFLQKKDGDYELFSSLKNADIVHALNTAEYNYFLEYGIPAEKIFLIPNGVPDNQISLSQISVTKRTNGVSFIGSWTLRKGIKDINTIVIEAQKNATVDKVNLLGGGDARVQSFFSTSLHPLLTVISNFSQNELPALLQHSKVGIFPSYAEGFGLAILEQLALGIPVVAYVTPGPKDILEPLDERLLVEPGDKVACGKRVSEILNMEDEEYLRLSLKCMERAKQFKMSLIAMEFMKVYQQGLSELG